MKRFLTLILFLTSVAAMSWAVATQFANNYDCQRSPAYPVISDVNNISGVKSPFVGYKGAGKVNTSAGPWKIEYVGYYDETNTTYNTDAADNVATLVYVAGNVSSAYKVAKDKLEVYRLYQWNSTANEFQHAAYGIMCAYANESNTSAGHAALLIAQGTSLGYGCFLTDNTYTSGDNLSISFDKDASTGFPELHLDPTGIDSQKSNVESRKILRDGQLFILRDGRTFNALGTEVK